METGVKRLTWSKGGKTKLFIKAWSDMVSAVCDAWCYTQEKQNAEELIANFKKNITQSAEAPVREHFAYVETRLARLKEQLQLIGRTEEMPSQFKIAQMYLASARPKLRDIILAQRVVSPRVDFGCPDQQIDIKVARGFMEYAEAKLQAAEQTPSIMALAPAHKPRAPAPRPSPCCPASSRRSSGTRSARPAPPR